MDALEYWKTVDERLAGCNLSIAEMCRSTGITYSRLISRRSRDLLPGADTMNRIEDYLSSMERNARAAAETFWNEVDNILQAKGMSYQTLSEIVGIPQRKMSAWKKSRRLPQGADRYKIELVLEIRHRTKSFLNCSRCKENENETAISLFQAIKNEDPKLLEYLTSRFIGKKNALDLQNKSIL